MQTNFLKVAISALALLSASVAGAENETHASAFLQSLFNRARIEAPRLHSAARQTLIAHPSLLQRWGVVSADAAAAYNDWTNTLVLQPEMTITTTLEGTRIRTLEEMALTTGTAANINATTVFHELSHAEWDFFVEEGATAADRSLVSEMEQTLPPLLKRSAIPFYNQHLAESEVFAYYREDLIGQILQDASEILLGSGLDPKDLSCVQTRHPGKLRDLMPDSRDYAIRVRVDTAWVQGKDVDLTQDQDLHRQLNDALYEHSLETLRFPGSRTALFQILEQDQRVMSALLDCAVQPPIR